mgnify:CR=1 FL=1
MGWLKLYMQRWFYSDCSFDMHLHCKLRSKWKLYTMHITKYNMVWNLMHMQDWVQKGYCNRCLHSINSRFSKLPKLQLSILPYIPLRIIKWLELDHHPRGYNDFSKHIVNKPEIKQHAINISSKWSL